MFTDNWGKMLKDHNNKMPITPSDSWNWLNITIHDYNTFHKYSIPYVINVPFGLLAGIFFALVFYTSMTSLGN